MSEHDLSHAESNDCPVVEELLSPFIDEELNTEADAYVRRHLDSCSRCMARLDEIKATVEALNSLPNEATPEQDLWPGIVAGSRESDIALPLGAGYRRRWRPSKPMLWAAGLAALLVPGSLVVAGLRMRDRPAVPPPPVPTADAPSMGFDAGAIAEAIRMAQEMAAEIAAVAAEAAADAAEAAQEHEMTRMRLGLDALVKALQDVDGEIRATAARALGEYDDARAVRALSAALLEDPEAEVRRWAAWALGEIGDSRATAALREAVEDDPEAVVRRWAAWSLGEIGDPRSTLALAETVVKDPVAEVRRWAAWALGEIGDPRAEDALTAAMKDESAEVRRWAMWALGKIGGR